MTVPPGFARAVAAGARRVRRNEAPSVRGDEPSFDDPRAAWGWLKQARKVAEDAHPDWNGGSYSSTVDYLDYASGEEEYGDGVCPFGDELADWPLAADGTGAIGGTTPGVGDHENDDEAIDDAGVLYWVVARG
jgi:hypothetical protein